MYISGTAYVEQFEEEFGEARRRWFRHVQMREYGYFVQEMLNMEQCVYYLCVGVVPVSSQQR